MNEFQSTIEVFTDGSFNPQWKIGGWAAIFVDSENETLLKGYLKNGSQHLMELYAVVESLLYLQRREMLHLKVFLYTDSQYVVDLMQRRKKLEKQQFMSKAGNPIVYQDLIKKYYQLMDQSPVTIHHVPSHQKQHTGYDQQRKVDKIARQIVRKIVKELA